MKFLQKGATYSVSGVPESSFRVLESNETVTYTIDLVRRAYVPKEHLTQKLLKDLEDGLIEKAADVWKPQYREDQLSKKQIDKRNQRYDIISSFWEDDFNRRRYFERPTRWEAIDDLAHSLKVTDRTALSLLSQFLRGGLTRNSLVPYYNRRGPARTESDSGRKRGFKGKNPSTLGIRSQERKQFEEAYRKVYLNRNKNTLRDTYNYVLDHYYSREVIMEDGSRKYIRFTDKVPSFDQFLYWRKKHKNLEEEERFRYGDTVYNNDLKVDRGGSRERVMGPGSCFESDATNLPINLVSKYNKDLIIGIPNLFTSIDVFTGMITGFYLGLEHESARTAARMLMNVIEDKVEFCSRYGIEITEEEWPSHHLPRYLMADHGALDSERIINAGHNSGMLLAYAPPYNPISKPNIENSHKKFQDFIASNLPGAYKDDAGKRGAPDYRQFACMTIDELTKVIIELILHFNKMPNELYPLTPKMQADQAISSPAALWKWGVENGQSELIEVEDKERFRISLMLRRERVIGMKGIKLDNRYHVGADDEARRVMNNHRGESVGVYLNEDNIAEIYFEHNDNYYPLKIKERHNDYRGLTSEEARELESASKAVRQEYSDLVNAGWSSKSKQIIKEASGFKNRIPESKSERRKRVNNIRENKEDYLRARRLEEAFQEEGGSIEEPKTVKDKNEGFNRRRKEFLENLKKEMYKDEK